LIPEAAFPAGVLFSAFSSPLPVSGLQSTLMGGLEMLLQLLVVCPLAFVGLLAGRFTRRRKKATVTVRMAAQL
jgi:hypothetical protein